jgi:hypothetical protein
MVKTAGICAVAFAAAILVLPIAHTPRSSSASTPTFSADVAPIIFKNCAECHRPGEIAPMSLLTYKDARPWAQSIRQEVASGQMPPWHATQPRGTFSNDRRLTDQDRDTLIRWVDAGAPEGNPKYLPPQPDFIEGWQIGKPDLVLTMPKEFAVPASGEIAYQNISVPTNFTEDKWVQAIEVRPGTRAVVHHILVFCREPGTQLDPMPYRMVVPKMEREWKRWDRLIATTAPGTNAMILPPGQALLIRAGAVLRFQIHYTANGTAATDRSSVGIVFANKPPVQEIRTSAFANPTFVIGPGDPNHEVDSAIEFTEDAHILGLIPHTHLRGKSWEYRMVYADGHSESILSVPHYDFNWQTYYVFAKPLAAPRGARLEAVAHYDNSTANKSNPNPNASVKWGDQTWDEMQYTGITYSIDNQSRP